MIPSQLVPFPKYPGLQVQLKLPIVFEHVA